MQRPSPSKSFPGYFLQRHYLIRVFFCLHVTRMNRMYLPQCVLWFWQMFLPNILSMDINKPNMLYMVVSLLINYNYFFEINSKLVIIENYLFILILLVSMQPYKWGCVNANMQSDWRQQQSYRSPRHLPVTGCRVIHLLL